MKYKYYLKIAETVICHFQFSYFGCSNRLATIKCARHLQKVHRDHPDGKVELLPIIAKHFYISENNRTYAIHQKKDKIQWRPLRKSN